MESEEAVQIHDPARFVVRPFIWLRIWLRKGQAWPLRVVGLFAMRRDQVQSVRPAAQENVDQDIGHRLAIAGGHDQSQECAE